MSLGYTSAQELQDVVEGQIVIELLPHACNLPEEVLIALEPPQVGYYLPGSIVPYLAKGTGYSYREVRTVASPKGEGVITEWVNHPVELFEGVDITRLNLPGDLVTARDGAIIAKKSWPHIRKLLRTQPDVPAQACLSAVGTVLQYLDSLCSHTRIQQNNCNLYSLVKRQHYNAIEDGIFDQIFDKLLLQVEAFVGKDTWNFYSYRISGTSLILVKGIDVRIYEWYCAKFDEQESRTESGMDEHVTFEKLQELGLT